MGDSESRVKAEEEEQTETTERGPPQYGGHSEAPRYVDFLVERLAGGEEHDKELAEVVCSHFASFDAEEVLQGERYDVRSTPFLSKDFPETDCKALTELELRVVCRALKDESGVVPRSMTLIGVPAMTAFWSLYQLHGAHARLWEEGAEQAGRLKLFKALLKKQLFASVAGFVQAGCLPPVEEPLAQSKFVDGLLQRERVLVESEAVRALAIEFEARGGDLLAILEPLLIQGHKPYRTRPLGVAERRACPLSVFLQRHQTEAGLMLMHYGASVKDANESMGGRLFRFAVETVQQSGNGTLLFELCAAGLGRYGAEAAQSYLRGGPAAREVVEAGNGEFDLRMVTTRSAVETVMPRVLAEIVTSYALLYIPPDEEL